MTQTPETVRAGYDAVAGEYARHFRDELARKPLDREMLGRFAGAVGGGPVVDLGCGPGQTTAFLHGLGANVRGIDLSGEMVREAVELYPGIEFRQGDMLALELPDGSLAGVVAFYAIVHLAREELARAFGEMLRVLRPGGLLLVTFHVGEEAVHVDELLGRSVSLDFFFFPSAEVASRLREAGFEAVEVTEREPYPEVEYPSRRAYVFARKPREG